MGLLLHNIVAMCNAAQIMELLGRSDTNSPLQGRNHYFSFVRRFCCFGELGFLGCAAYDSDRSLKTDLLSTVRSVACQDSEAAINRVRDSAFQQPRRLFQICFLQAYAAAQDR